MQHKPQFHQTVSSYFPMSQHTQIAGVPGGLLLLGQVHSQIAIAEDDNVVYMDSGSTVKTLRSPRLFRNLHTSS